jgi:hypothetical protein
LSNSIVASGDHHLTIEPAGTSQQTYQLQLINAYDSNAARSYIGQYTGHLYITNNRYFNGSWNSNTSDAGGFYVQSSNGYHEFKHFPAGSNTAVQDLFINGPSGFIRSEHNFRLGANSISNDGSGGLTFDTSGNATFANNVILSNTGSARLKIEADTDNVTETHVPSILMTQDGNIFAHMIAGESNSGDNAIGSTTNALLIATTSSTGSPAIQFATGGNHFGTHDLPGGSNDTLPTVALTLGENQDATFAGNVLLGANSISNDGSGGLTFDTSGNGTFDGFIKAQRLIYSHITTGSSSTGGGKWTRITRVNLTGQYQSAACTFEISGSNSGASAGLYAKVRFRVKQQASLGNAPFIDLDVFDYQRLTENYFKAVTVQNDASATIVDLYVTMVDSYVNYVFTPHNVYQDSKFTFYSSDGLVSSLPAGAQTDAVPRALIFSSDGDATTPRDLDVSRYFHSVGYATFDSSVDISGNASFGSTTGFGGRIETGGNWISYASADRGMSVDAYGRVLFRVEDARIENIVLDNTYNSNYVRSYLGQYQTNFYLANNARYVSGQWFVNKGTEYSERMIFSDGKILFGHAYLGSSQTWYRNLHIDGPNGKAGFFTSSPASALHIHESSTGGTDEDILTVTTQSGGGFSLRCSDLSASNPTWKLRSNGSEAMELFVGTNDGQLTLNTDGTSTFGGSVKLNNLSGIDAAKDIRKTSDETNSTKSLQDDNHLTFTAEANTKYYVDFELFVNLVSSASNEGFKFDITGPSSPTAVAYRAYGISDTDGMVVPSGGEATAFSTSRTIPFSVSSAHDGVVKIRLYLDNGANSGSVTLRWAWDQDGGLFDNVTVYKESFMTVKAVA